MVFAFTGMSIIHIFHLTVTVFMFNVQVLNLVTVVVCRNVNCQIPPLTHRLAGRAFFLPGIYL